MHSDRNLFFGIVALQMDFVDKVQLILAMNAWVLSKQTPLGEILVRQAALKPADRELLEAIVSRHLELHENDAEKSLASLSSIGSLRLELASLADAELDRSLAHVSAARFNDPDGTASWTVGASTSLGERFRVLRPHARGGLGEVFVALDSELNREVALKQIHESHADNPASRARFMLEGEITGGLEHPGIVPVYGLGHDVKGRPFYAMRFIKGKSLREAIKRFHEPPETAADPAQRALEFRNLLSRFIEVCNAVAYAHIRGVLHRDLKPGNVMLGDFGETLIVDWGLAKLVGRAECGDSTDEWPLRPTAEAGSTPTLAGQALGTLPYCSPEQAAGQIDQLGPPSDVYSLGATLYSLLTGQAPFDSQDPEIANKLSHGLFPRPRQLNAQIPRPLEAVCLKAMSLRQADRYQSPLDLAAEIQRFLGDQPTAAWREPAWVRARRWVRRHRTAAAALAAALVILAAGGPFVAFREARLRQEAEANYASARQAVDNYVKTVTTAELLKEERFKPLLKDLLGDARAFYEELIRNSEGRPDHLADLAEATITVGDLDDRIGSVSEAGLAYTRAVETYRQLVAENPGEPAFQSGLAKSYWALGNLQSQTAEVRNAFSSFNEALAIQRKLAAAHATATQFQSDLAGIYTKVGRLHQNTGDLQEALASYQQAQTIYETLVVDNPTVTVQRGLATTCNNVGLVQDANGDTQGAFASFNQALEIQQMLAAEDPTATRIQNDLAGTFSNLGIHHGTRDVQSALSNLRQAQSIFEKLAAANPTVSEFRERLAFTDNHVGMFQMMTGDRQAGQANCSKAIEIFEVLARESPQSPDIRNHLASALTNMGNYHRAFHNPPLARQLLLQAAPHHQAALAINPSHPQYRDFFRNNRYGLTMIQVELGAHAEATEAAKHWAEYAQGADDLYKAAGFTGRCIGLASNDPVLTPDERANCAKRYADQAMSHLTEAVAQGWRNAAQMREDPDLAPLRGREDFEALLAGFEAKP